MQRVHSFDLVSSAPHVTACNIASVPLPNSSVDVAVFSLALMGIDYGKFLAEAARVLRHKGWLWIAEVRVKNVACCLL
jgi:ribosomal RNA-processing protein 8